MPHCCPAPCRIQDLLISALCLMPVSPCQCACINYTHLNGDICIVTWLHVLIPGLLYCQELRILKGMRGAVFRRGSNEEVHPIYQRLCPLLRHWGSTATAAAWCRRRALDSAFPNCFCSLWHVHKQPPQWGAGVSLLLQMGGKEWNNTQTKNQSLSH